MTVFTQADVFRPTSRKNALIYDLALVASASLFIALMAQITIYLPFSPVPITGQTLAVLLIGMLLGSKRGSLAVLAYLAEGATGLPVFAGGLSGPAVLAGPTGGYLAGFAIAAYAAGWLAERGWDRHVLTTVAAMLIGNIVIYALGLIWLAQFVGADKAFVAGLYPFIPGDLLKIALAAMLLPSGWKLLGLSGKQINRYE